MPECDIAITVARGRRAQIEAVADAVSRAGILVERVIPALGAIYGRGEEACMPAVRAVAGVERVRLAGTVELSPLDPSIPQ